MALVGSELSSTGSLLVAGGITAYTALPFIARHTEAAIRAIKTPKVLFTASLFYHVVVVTRVELASSHSSDVETEGGCSDR